MTENVLNQGTTKAERLYAERQRYLDKYGTLKFTRFDPDIKAGKLPKDKWQVPPYKINISCDYIKPLYEKYKRIVSPNCNILTDAQRYDFECIIKLVALQDLSPDEKIKKAEHDIALIKENEFDYIPYAHNQRCLFPLRALGTIYQGSIKSIDIDRTHLVPDNK